jgi:adenylate kinase family enzyme
MQRISVIGATGSGKTTVARRTAEALGVPHIELDALHWEPDWEEAPLEVFRERVSDAIQGERWVVDGNYSKVRDMVWGRADTVLWLDYPFLGTRFCSGRSPATRATGRSTPS